MLTRKEKREWLIKNCLNDFNYIDLSDLDLSGYAIDTSGIIAEDIYQCNQIAKSIKQGNQIANEVHQFGHTAEMIIQCHHDCEKIVPQDLNGYEGAYDEGIRLLVYRKIKEKK